MRKEVLGSLFILIVMVASLFTFLIPQGGNGTDGTDRDLQLTMSNTELNDILSVLPDGVEEFLYTDFSDRTGDELALWAAASTGAPSEGMLGRSPDWFINVVYPRTQGSSSFEMIEHWILMMSFGNSTIYEYPNTQAPYNGINITRHPNFYYTPNTDPVLVTATENDLLDTLDIWLQDDGGVNGTAAEQLDILMRNVPDEANWALFSEYSNSTSPLNFSDKVFTSITTIDGGDYYLNVSSHIRYNGQPDTSLFTTPSSTR